MARKPKSAVRQRKRKEVAKYFAEGKASWIFVLWAVLLLGNSLILFFAGKPFMGAFWFGVLSFFGAIVFCPCYARKTCEIIGLPASHGPKK